MYESDSLQVKHRISISILFATVTGRAGCIDPLCRYVALQIENSRRQSFWNIAHPTHRWSLSRAQCELILTVLPGPFKWQVLPGDTQFRRLGWENLAWEKYSMREQHLRMLIGMSRDPFSYVVETNHPYPSIKVAIYQSANPSLSYLVSWTIKYGSTRHFECVHNIIALLERVYVEIVAYTILYNI